MMVTHAVAYALIIVTFVLFEFQAARNNMSVQYVLLLEFTITDLLLLLIFYRICQQESEKKQQSLKRKTTASSADLSFLMSSVISYGPSGAITDQEEMILGAVLRSSKNLFKESDQPIDD